MPNYGNAPKDGNVPNFATAPKNDKIEPEEYLLLSTTDDSEIYEVPLNSTGDVPLHSIRAIMGHKCQGIYTLSNGRKRIIVANENQLIVRPRGGWSDKIFYPLEPPRGSSRPSTAKSVARSSPSPKPNSLLDGTYDEVRAVAEVFCFYFSRLVSVFCSLIHGQWAIVRPWTVRKYKKTLKAHKKNHITPPSHQHP